MSYENMSRLFSASELSRELRVPISAVLRHVHAGRVKPARVGKALIFDESMAQEVARMIGDKPGEIHRAPLA